MNAEIKAQWVAALRSGEYAQVEGYLNDGEGYCCLGVLCDLAAKARVVAAFRDDDGVYRYGAERNVGDLPAEVKAWAGLDESDPGVDWTDEEGDTDRLSLATLNDDYGQDFRQIADLIDAQL